MNSAQAPAQVTIRQARPEDAPACGAISYRAFKAINEGHGFPPGFDSPEQPAKLLASLYAHLGFHCVVAESDGLPVGSSYMDERAAIAGIGMVTVDPEAQKRGVGRLMMQSLLDRAAMRGCAGIRLIQAAFNLRSLSLYTSLGFEVREPLVCLQGRTRQRALPGCVVRPAAGADLEACNLLCLKVHGFHRGTELAEGIQRQTAVVVERDGRVSAYASSLGWHGHTVAQTNLDLQALIASAESFPGPGILLPARNTALFHWCLAQGLRAVLPMTLMSQGLYEQPQGAWLASIIF